MANAALRRKPLKSLSIVLLCILAAVLYGIVHDEITALICVEYFTIGHPDIFGTDSPTLLGLGWGIVATWWVGLALGIILALASRFGHRPKVAPQDLVRPIGRLLLVMACCAAAAGLMGLIAARLHWVYLEGEMAAAVPSSKHRAFLVDLWMHLTSYGVGFLGGIFISIGLSLHAEAAQDFKMLLTDITICKAQQAKVLIHQDLAQASAITGLGLTLHLMQLPPIFQCRRMNLQAASQMRLTSGLCWPAASRNMS